MGYLEIDFSTNTFCLDAWEFHDWILATYPDILTTKNRDAVKRVRDAMYEEAYRRLERIEYYLDCTCEMEIIMQWHFKLGLKSSFLTWEPPPKTEIRIVPPARILPRASHRKERSIEEQRDRREGKWPPQQPSSSHTQPADQFVQPPTQIPKTEKSVSEFLANLDNEEE